MTTTAAAPKFQDRAHLVVQELLEARNRMLVEMERLAGLKPFNDGTVHQVLPGFLQELVDYLALGHFEVFQGIDEEHATLQAFQEAYARLYPAILETTDAVMTFNDKYEGQAELNELTAELHDEVSELGVTLASRMILEDQLIDALIGA